MFQEMCSVCEIMWPFLIRLSAQCEFNAKKEEINANWTTAEHWGEPPVLSSLNMLFMCIYPFSIWILQVMQQCVCVFVVSFVVDCFSLASHKEMEWTDVGLEPLHTVILWMFALTEPITVCQRQDVNWKNLKRLFIVVIRQNTMSLTRLWVHTSSRLFVYYIRFCPALVYDC